MPLTRSFAIATLALAPASSLAAPQFADIYAFHEHQGIEDGITPRDVIYNAGALYGVTNGGGSGNKGIVFQVDLAGNETILYNFTGGADGGSPVAGLTVLGTLAYGTASIGGSSGKGVVYSIDLATGTEKVLYSFAGGDGDGDTPYSDLLAYKGKLYGVTLSGGQDNAGTVFVIDPASGVESIVLNVAPFGQNPEAGLAVYNGELYGTAAYGASGYGSIFKVNLKTGVGAYVHGFQNTDGSLPGCDLAVYQDVIYGCTTQGGNRKSGYGTVFSFNPATKAFISLYSLDDTNGNAPNGRMAVTNAGIYVTAAVGGPANDGTILLVNATSGKAKLIHGFVGTDGGYPGGIVFAKGVFYGSTEIGGTAGNGVVYQYKK